MSSDNGIYILETKGPEYRVSHALAIDNIYGNINDQGKWNGDPEMIDLYFSKAVVWFDRGQALVEAHSMAEKEGPLEYGVCILDSFKDKRFEDLVVYK
jgi:hypothetical protein